MKRSYILLLMIVTILSGCQVQGTNLGEEQQNTQEDSQDEKEEQITEPEELVIVLPDDSENNEENPDENIENNTEEPSQDYIKYYSEDNYFELPIQGATGFGTIKLNVRKEADSNSTLLQELNPGVGFRIMEEEGEWWLVDTGEVTGYVFHDYCMINLPDVLPSIIYKNTNSSASIFRTSYLDIPNLTNKQLYDVYTYNERLEKDQYSMPILYSMAKKVAYAQSMAMENGYTLVIYETYRPYEVQHEVVDKLSSFIESNSTANAGINDGKWGIGWFIATSLSNHQRGIAMDTSIGTVLSTQECVSGDYIYTEITEYEECEMPTPMHELSTAAVCMAYPVSSNNDEDWRTVSYAPTMTEGAIKLREYCTEAGLSPLASEWWHFNDLFSEVSPLSKGQYYIKELKSTQPEL